jgi:8-oxo-dGTP pyrophosphatase MutT (NUDIX family)
MEAIHRLLSDEGEGSIFENYWAKRGAGCVLMAQDTLRFLLPFRSAEVSEPHTYGTWGGAIDPGENPQIAVRRELGEEAGFRGVSTLFPLLVNCNFDSGCVYHNFLCVIPSEFDPVLNWETEHALWLHLDEFPEPLHPGLRSLLNDPRSMQAINYQMKRAYHV